MQNKRKIKLTRRDFLHSGMVFFSGAVLSRFNEICTAIKTQKRIYLALDDHTDYFWSAGEETYKQAFLEMLDYYLDQVDQTQGNPPDFQGRWNCDGSYLGVDLRK